MTESGATQEINVQELFVTLGRVEAKVDNLGGLDARLRVVERDVHTLKEVQAASAVAQATQQTRKATWPAIVGAVVGIVTGISVIIGMFITLNSIATAITNSGITP